MHPHPLWGAIDMDGSLRLELLSVSDSTGLYVLSMVNTCSLFLTNVNQPFTGSLWKCHELNAD